MRSKRVIWLSTIAVLVAVSLTTTVTTLSRRTAHHADAAAPAGVAAATAGRFIRVPLPADAAVNPHAWLGPVACAAPSRCVAIGSYDDSSGNGQGFLLTGSVFSWKARKAPIPTNAYAQPDAGLNSIACPSPSGCIVTGSYNAGSYGNRHGFLLTGSGDSWKAFPIPLPPGVDPLNRSDFGSVVCASPSRCMIPGSYTDPAGNSQNILAIGSGVAWTAIKAPTQAYEWGAITCPSSVRCLSAGSYSVDNSSHQQDVSLLIGVMKSWTVAKIPLPANADPSAKQNSGLNDVSCSSVQVCTAIGTYTDAGNEDGLLAVHQDKAWTAIKAPVPRGTDAPYGTTLWSITCSTSTKCVAAGTYVDSYQLNQAMIVTGSGAHWTATKAPLPGNADPGQPNSVSDIICPTTSSCIATGGYTDAHGWDHWMILTRSDGPWTAAELAMPKGAKLFKGNALPNGPSVACPTPSICLFTGTYTDSSGHDQGLLLIERS